MSQLHQGRIKNDALRISNFRNRLDHSVILCFTDCLSKLFSPPPAPGALRHVRRSLGEGRSSSAKRVRSVVGFPPQSPGRADRLLAFEVTRLRNVVGLVSRFNHTTLSPPKPRARLRPASAGATSPRSPTLEIQNRPPVGPRPESGPIQTTRPKTTSPPSHIPTSEIPFRPASASLPRPAPTWSGHLSGLRSRT